MMRDCKLRKSIDVNSNYLRLRILCIGATSCRLVVYILFCAILVCGSSGNTMCTFDTEIYCGRPSGRAWGEEGVGQ